MFNLYVILNCKNIVHALLRIFFSHFTLASQPPHTHTPTHPHNLTNLSVSLVWVCTYTLASKLSVANFLQCLLYMPSRQCEVCNYVILLSYAA